MQICATQLGGQVAATSFEPITWRALLKAPRRRTKRTRFCCFGIFFAMLSLPCCFYMTTKSSPVAAAMQQLRIFHKEIQ